MKYNYKKSNHYSTLNDSSAEPIKFDKNPKTVTIVIFLIGYIPPHEMHSTLKERTKQLAYLPKNLVLFLKYLSNLTLYSLTIAVNDSNNIKAKTTNIKKDPPHTINGISFLLENRMQRTADTTAFTEKSACVLGRYTTP